MFNRNKKSAEPKRKHDLSQVNICLEISKIIMTFKWCDENNKTTL